MDLLSKTYMLLALKLIPSLNNLKCGSHNTVFFVVAKDSKIIYRKCLVCFSISVRRGRSNRFK